MRIAYHKVDIRTIMDFWATEYRLKDGESLSDYKFFYDAAKGKVIFELFIKEADPENEKQSLQVRLGWL